MADPSEPEQAAASLPPAPAVGWIGLGEMGLPMAANLVAAGHRVVGLDREPGRGRHPGRDRGGELVVGAGRERRAMLVTMLRTGVQTEALLLGPEGVAAAAPRPRDVVMMSTMDPPAMERARRRVRRARPHDPRRPGQRRRPRRRGGDALDHGLRRPGGAGADPAAAGALGARIHVLGDRPGMSQAAKLANQVMMAVAIAGTYEALGLARDYGVEPGAVIGAVLDGTGAQLAARPLGLDASLWEEYEPENALDILDKDMKAVIAAVRERECRHAGHRGDLRPPDRALGRGRARRRAAERRVEPA